MRQSKAPACEMKGPELKSCKTAELDRPVLSNQSPVSAHIPFWWEMNAVKQKPRGMMGDVMLVAVFTPERTKSVYPVPSPKTRVSFLPLYGEKTSPDRPCKLAPTPSTVGLYSECCDSYFDSSRCSWAQRHCNIWAWICQRWSLKSLSPSDLTLGGRLFNKTTLNKLIFIQGYLLRHLIKLGEFAY